MVPSDPLVNSFSSRHARLEHGIRITAWRWPFAPRCRFYPASDQSSGARPLSRSGRNPFLDTAFRSPSARIHLSANLRGRVNVPGLHLRNDSEIFPGPFGSELPSPVGFLWPRGVRSMLVTRCQVRSRNSASVLRLPLPVRISQSLRLVAPSLIPNVEACP